MTERRIPVIDIEPLGKASTIIQGEKNSLGWSRSDNTFKFNFIPEGESATPKEVPGQVTSWMVQPTESTAFTGQGSGFAFNFKIPMETPDEMKTEKVEAAPLEGLASDKNTSDKEEKPQQNEPPTSSKAKKKKKKSSQKRKPVEGTDQKQEQTSSSSTIEGAHQDNGTELSAEQQLKRELDWCIEQLELGMTTQKCTVKQKEEASRALKTLRSSKAPLAKKRQVMRSMSGDYRKKMEEEKDKQFKLIQAAMSSANVKAISKPAEKSVFHRKADCKTQTLKSTEKDQQGKSQMHTHSPSTGVQSKEETSNVVFAASKEEFCFNFL